MSGDLPVVPAVSTGETETVRSARIEGIGGPVAEVARTPRVTARDALATARGYGFEALRTTPVRELLDVLAEAGLRFEGVGLPAGLDGADGAGGGPWRADGTDGTGDDTAGTGANANTYERRVARATGLPVGWVRTSAHWLGHGLRHAAEALRAQSPTGGLDVYDDPAYTRERDVGLAFAPRVRVLGAVMPGNDPAVYAWPALALAMKVPVVLRPSDRDPFTAVRLARALLAAGLPPAAVHVLPGERTVGELLRREADHAMVFGDESAVADGRDDPSVEAYGPGDSVAVVAREPTDLELDTLARGIQRSGGRACFNLTRIVATRECDPDALADGLARRLAHVSAGPIEDPATDLPAFPDPAVAERVDDRIADLGEDVTADYRDGPRRVERDGAAVLRPTVLRAPEGVPELPFPFAGVTRVAEDDLLGWIGRAYLGVAVGASDLERQLARSPRVRKVYGGAYPAAVDLRETHERYLASFLYETTTYDPGSTEATTE